MPVDPEPIRIAVAIQRQVHDGHAYKSRLHRLIARYVDEQLYQKPSYVQDRLRREILSEVQREMLPYARAIGAASAEPILEALGEEFARESLRASATRLMGRYSKANLVAFRTELARELGGLNGQIEAAFARAYRDDVLRKQLIADLVKADRAEIEALGKAQQRTVAAGSALQDAEERLATASRRQTRDAARQVKEARKQWYRAKAGERATKSFVARFETAVQGHVRDTLRREAYTAQEAAFKAKGLAKPDSMMMWVAVNGSDACPQCMERGGLVLSERDWRARGKPGEGKTYCGDACMCQLVPSSYATGAAFVGENKLGVPPVAPIRPKAAPNVPAPRAMTPIRLGGRDVGLAKEAERRMRKR